MRFKKAYDALQNLIPDGVSQASLARTLNKSRSNINYMLKSNVLLHDEDVKKIEQKYNIFLTNEKKSTKTPLLNIDRIEINYWEDLPAEMKNPKIASVWFDREIIENAWGINPETLCIVPMVGDSLTQYWYPIRNGDILIVDKQIENIMGNGVYFGTSRNNTRLWIREMQVDMDMNVEFRSYSPSGEEQKKYTLKQLEDVDFRLIGKVIKNVSFRL